MIHIMKSFAAKVWAGLILLVVICGLLVAGLRLGLPLVDQYRGQLAADLSRVMQAPVRVDHLGARLSGLSPELRLSGVEILNPGDNTPLLRFEELRLRVDLIGSLRSLEPRVDQATIVNAHLIIRRQPDGEVYLIGLDVDQSGEAQTFISPAPFLSEGRLRLLGGEIVWDNRRLGVPPVRFVEVEAQLTNAGSRHQLDIEGRIAGSGRGELRADFYGDPAAPMEWSGDVYFKGSGIGLAPLAKQLLPPGYHLDGEAEAQLWSHWSGGRGGSLTGHVVLHDLLLGDDPNAAGLERVSGWLDWRREEGGWLLGFRDLQVDHGDRLWPGIDLALRVRKRATAGTQVQVGAAQLWLEELASVAQTLPIEEEWRALLEELQPRGELRDWRLNLELPIAGELRWQSAGKVAGLGLEPRGGAPGVKGLDLEFRLDAEHGQVRLGSQKLELRFKDLFRWPLRADRLGGELNWRLLPGGGLEISGDEIVLENQDLKTRSRLLLRLADAAPPFLDMQTDFSDGDGSNARLYLPAGVLEPKLVRWLDRAIVSGRATSGAFLFRGPMNAYPFRGEEGRFEVLFGVEQGILDYQQEWPRLEELTAEIRFLNEGLEARLLDGRLLESQVQQTLVSIPDLGRSPALAVDGRVRGPFADTFRILRETPLAARQARYVRGMQAQGESRVDLDLTIPLHDQGEYRVDGRLHWDGATLSLPDWGLDLDRIKGSLTFTDEGVFAKRVKARLWGDPVHLDVDTSTPERGKPGRTRIGVDLKLSVKQLAKRYPHWLWSQLHGTAPGRLLLDVGHSGQAEGAVPLSFRIESGLKGMAVALPLPLVKGAEETRPLFVAGALPLAPGGIINGGYGDIAGSFRLAAAAGGGLTLDAARLSCGVSGAGAKPSPVRGKGFKLSGSLSKLDLSAWVDWFADQGSHLQLGDEEEQPPPYQVDLHIQELLLPQGALSNLQLGLVRTPHAWDADLKADQLLGTVRVPDQLRKNPVSIALKSLRLDLDDWNLQPSPPGEKPSWPDPRKAPGLFVKVDQLYVSGRDLGRLILKAEPSVDGLRLEQLDLVGPEVTLQGKGAWSGTAAAQQTQLHLEAHSPDLGKLTRELQFTTAIEQSDLTMQTDLRWPAPPLEANLNNLQGDLEFKMGKGQVVSVDPGMGRIFGLLNLGALQRRLTLDFSDLFGKGYAFDSIDGRFSIGSGVAEAKKVNISGPGADMEITGKTDLLSRDYDQLVTVTPEISVTLPLAGAIVGGPVAAAALVVAEQVMGEEVNKLTRFQYRVTGPWSDPKVERVVTEDGWSLSNLFQPDDGSARAESAPIRSAVDEESGMFVH